MPHYNVMGVAKAALEAFGALIMAADLGPQNIRRQRALGRADQDARGLGDRRFPAISSSGTRTTPRCAGTPTIEEVGETAAFLVSDMARGITGGDRARRFRLPHRRHERTRTRRTSRSTRTEDSREAGRGGTHPLLRPPRRDGLERAGPPAGRPRHGPERASAASRPRPPRARCAGWCAAIRAGSTSSPRPLRRTRDTMEILARYARPRAHGLPARPAPRRDLLRGLGELHLARDPRPAIPRARPRARRTSGATCRRRARATRCSPSASHRSPPISPATR